jgi:hypothetical protein
MIFGNSLYLFAYYYIYQVVVSSILFTCKEIRKRKINHTLSFDQGVYPTMVILIVAWKNAEPEKDGNMISISILGSGRHDTLPIHFATHVSSVTEPSRAFGDATAEKTLARYK